MARVPKIDLEFCCFRLRIGQSKTHARGIYADQHIPPNRKVIECPAILRSWWESRRQIFLCREF